MAGGTTYINGGNIHHNTSGRFGGGIACGEPGAEQKSELVIRNTNISNNTSVSDGGGIWTPNGGGGMFSDLVIIMNSKIENNVSERAGGGIMVQCNVEMSDCRVAGNSAKGNAGGIHINTGGEFTLQSGYIGSNKCDVQGSGIYVKGRFNILSDAVVETNNIVYLTEGTYIDIIGKLNKSSGYIANIDSEVKTNGTKLVKADYTGTSATKELYYSKTADDEYKNSKVLKKYTYNNLPASRCLRPTEKVNGYDGIYIILSEKYTISYDKNTTENIDNMPDSQVKFWEENIKISDNIISRNGSSPNSAKHWNLNKDGSGTQVKPGSEYKINGNKTLYAQWILWQMILKDRYYMVGQKITLDKSELLKKTVIENGDSLSKYQFKIKQIKNGAGSVMVSGTDVVTDTYMNTIKPVQYTLKVEVSDSDLNTVTGEMIVYVLDVPIIKGSVRFISLGYISTLQSDSRWNLSLNERLVESLSKKQGQGCYKISISNEEIKDIKSKIRENNYKITNGMNKSLAGRLQRVVPSEN